MSSGAAHTTNPCTALTADTWARISPVPGRRILRIPGTRAETPQSEPRERRGVPFFRALHASEGRTNRSADKCAQDPASVALDGEPDDGLPAAPGVAYRDQATVDRGLVGVDPAVVTHPHARDHGVLGDVHDECLAAEYRTRPAPRRGAGDAHGARPMGHGVAATLRPRRCPCIRARSSMPVPSRPPISEPNAALEPYGDLGRRVEIDLEPQVAPDRRGRPPAESVIPRAASESPKTRLGVPVNRPPTCVSP